MTTVNNALDPISTLSNPNIYLYATSLDRDTSVDLGGPETVPGTSSRAPTTSATARFYTGALDEVFSSGTLRIRDVRNSDPQETCCAEFRSTTPRVTILFRHVFRTI